VVRLYYKVTDCIYLNRIKFSTSWCMMADSSVAKRKRGKHVRSGEKRFVLNVSCVRVIQKLHWKQ
jgi:hypothetical protein